jgi:hydroxypyruvate reductase
LTPRKKAIQIFEAAVAAVQPVQLIPAHLFIKVNQLHILDQPFLLHELPNIYIIGAGKASAAMAATTEAILGNFITAGIVVTKYGHALPLQKITCIEAAHPVPDEAGIEATKKTIQLLQQAGNNDIIICLISGGCSSLWIDIPDGATLNDVQKTFNLLLQCGANIEEINTIRKHLSAIKGGQLLQHAPKANWFTFIISDVPGDELSVIASGPTVADNSRFADVKNIVEKYALGNQLPASILKHINDGVNRLVSETPKPGDTIFKQVQNKIIGNNGIALQAAEEKAKEFGYQILLVDENMKGDAATFGKEIMNRCKQYSGNKPACILFGGETTVKVTGKGRGGRNQQLVLSALIELHKKEKTNLNLQLIILSAGTDGTDGPTDAAGAIADKEIVRIALENKLDAQHFLADNDAYHFFEQTGGLVKTGATQTNVMDVVVVLIDN